MLGLVGIIITPVVQMRKLRIPRGLIKLGHGASK